MTVEDMEKDVRIFKEYNVNCVRTSHYPPDPIFLDLCDEYGVSAVDDFLEFYKPEYLDMMPDAYEGVYDSREEFAEEKAIKDFNPEKMMGDFAYYFDYASYARDLFINDYYYGSHGSVIRRF